MRGARRRNLHLSGIDIVLPALVSIDCRSPEGAARLRVLAAFAVGHVEAIVAPLVGQWLAQRFHCEFAEHGRGADGNLAAEAFYDKLEEDFADDTPFAAVIVLARGAAATIGTANGCADRLLSGTKCIRWKCRGAVHAYVTPGTRLAQISFDELPGGIELVRVQDPAAAVAEPSRPCSLSAWYGFGVPLRSPADAIAALRKGAGEARHAPMKSHAA